MYSDPTLLGGGGLFAKMKLSLIRRRQQMTEGLSDDMQRAFIATRFDS